MMITKDDWQEYCRLRDQARWDWFARHQGRIFANRWIVGQLPIPYSNRCSDLEKLWKDNDAPGAVAGGIVSVPRERERRSRVHRVPRIMA